MSSVVKDNEVLASIPDAKNPSSSGDARPQPVALEVAVTVNGARTVAGSDKREPFSESTKTVLIFGNGAVVRLTSTVAPGQLLFLTNEKTKKEVVCQVVKSKNYSNVSGYVELEFTEPVAGFWGMRFPAAGSPAQTALPSKTSTGGTSSIATKPVGSVPTPEKKSPDANLSRPTTGAVTTPAAIAPTVPSNALNPAPSHSSSHPIHSYSATVPTAPAGSKPSNVLDISKSRVAKVDAPISSAKNAALPAKSILDSDEVKIPSWLEPLARNAAAASAALPEAPAKDPLHDHQDAEAADFSLTEISDTPEAAAHPIAGPTFGTHFLTEEDVISGPAATGGSSKKVLIAAIAAGILLAAGGGAWYVRQQKVNSAPVATAATTSTADAGGAAQVQAPAQVPASPSGNYTAISSPAASVSGVSASLTTANSMDPTTSASNANKKLATVDAPPPAAVVQLKKQKLGEVNLSAPVVNKFATGQNQSEEALNLGSSATGGGEALSSGLVTSSRQPVAPAAPLPVGGDVKAARLISSVPPQYPPMARSQRVGGDVKIDALVDINGQVAGMKIISGPVLLQQPAMDAVRRWKYEAAQLNGKAVPMHLTVTVQFKLQ